MTIAISLFIGLMVGFWLGRDFDKFRKSQNTAEIRWSNRCECGHTRDYHEKHWPACKGFREAHK